MFKIFSEKLSLFLMLETVSYLEIYDFTENYKRLHKENIGLDFNCFKM